MEIYRGEIAIKDAFNFFRIKIMSRMVRDQLEMEDVFYSYDKEE
jgi:hypothetical protein